MKKLYFSLVAFLFLVVANAQIVNIPNYFFKTKLIQLGVDTNHDGNIQNSEALVLTILDISSADISSLTGIESFTNLQTLNCSSNYLSTLDVTSLTNLQNLDCFSNQLTSLDVTGLTILQTLNCYNNQLSSLNISGLTNLQYLNCSSNQLTSLDVSGLTNLQTLYCSSNQITSLNISGSTNLQTLNCFGNQLPTLNVSGLTNLQTLNCSGNQLPTLNVSGLTNLQTLSCSSNHLQSLNFSGLTNLQTLDCSSNQLPSLTVSGLTNLVSLDCSSNQLPSLTVSGLTNLVSLDCSYSHLTSLTVSGLTHLQSLSFDNNPLTSLVVSGLNFQSFNCSNYQLTSLTMSNLTNLQNLYCSSNQLQSLTVSGLTNLRTLDCSSNQLLSLDVSGLTNLQTMNCSQNHLPSLNFSDLTSLQTLNCYNNQLSSLNISGLTNLQYLNCSSNQLTSLDVSGLTNLQTLYCSSNQITSLDLSGSTNLHILWCFYNQLTSLLIKNNNSNWVGLSFHDNPSLEYICADEEDLTYVQQKITDCGYSTTCHVNSYCSFTPGGTFYTIQGTNKIDENNNGCDANDLVYPNLKFSITNGTVSGSLISNNSGNYSIPVSAGTHTIIPQFENLTYFIVSPTSATVTFPATPSPSTQNFCISPNGTHHDLEVVVIPVNVARPGFDATYKIKYKNKGNQIENATINFNYNDTILDFVSSSIAPTSQATGTRSWNIGTIAPFQNGEILVTLNINSPTETPAVIAGNILNYLATINGLNTDETTIDNAFALNQVVVNSYDPNDKKCLEGETLSSSKIGEYVHYQIRFENTGTFPAQNIVVKDIIDTTKFDISTLQMTDASHSCVTKISNTNKVEFIFENINLPFDDATNDGYVVFKIKTKPTLVVGNTISNSANIYFDYNFPIVTNTATSTFQTLANNDFYLDKNVSLSPIPTKDNLTISLQDSEKINSVSIYNMLGQVVQTVIGSNNIINVSELKTGDYIIKITTENGSISKKFIKE